MPKKLNDQLCTCVQQSVTQYLNDLNGQQVNGIYELVISEIEKPLLAAVMEYTDHNQSKAARTLGINRNTLRKKLELYKLVDSGK